MRQQNSGLNRQGVKVHCQCWERAYYTHVTIHRLEFRQWYISSNCSLLHSNVFQIKGWPQFLPPPPHGKSIHIISKHDKKFPNVCASGFDGQFGEATYHSLSFFLTAGNLVKFEKLGNAHSWGNFFGVDWGLKWGEEFGWEYAYALRWNESEWFEWILIDMLWFWFTMVMISTTQKLGHCE